ncbi:hypothetical protein OH77DRAFT_589604 [Trametes cingulata]|nr:hypothetical protein OH77DRAFT_589604 [Trametes cingulata]
MTLEASPMVSACATMDMSRPMPRESLARQAAGGDHQQRVTQSPQMPLRAQPRSPSAVESERTSPRCCPGVPPMLS